MSVKGGKRRASVNFAVSRVANTEKKYSKSTKIVKQIHKKSDVSETLIKNQKVKIGIRFA